MDDYNADQSIERPGGDIEEAAEHHAAGGPHEGNQLVWQARQADNMTRPGPSGGAHNGDNDNSGGGGTVPPEPDFDAKNGTDDPSVLAKLANIKATWMEQDVKYWFQEIEMQMEIYNIQSQWLKRVILANNLPEEVKAELKDILRKPKSQAPTLVYKELKLKIIQLFGPVEEEAFERAAALVLTSKPSALAKKITELLCTCDKPLENCCAAATVSALWKRQLPQQVRTAVAGMSLKENFENVLQKADDAYAPQDQQRKQMLPSHIYFGHWRCTTSAAQSVL